MRPPADRAAYAAFTAKLIAARKRAKLTQTEVAEQLGWRQSQVSEMETGERRVDIIELAKLATLYRKPLKWFVG